MSKTKGMTRWFLRSTPPVRVGEYECGVMITSSQPSLMKWNLWWDGEGFLVPCPMVVVLWRGLTKRAFLAEEGE